MNKSFLFATLTAIILLLSQVANANPVSLDPVRPTPQAMPQPDLTPTAPSLQAKAFILMDANSGKLIAEKNADERMAPASLTKMMTLYIISRALDSDQLQLDDKVRISKKAWKMGGSKMFVKVDTQVPVRELIQGIVVDSGNDACVAMAQYIAGSEEAFADLMNQQAQALGMKNTHYVDSTGLPHKNHYSTAHDMAKLAQALVHNFPQYYGWYKQKWFTYNGIKQANRNRLLWRTNFVDGIKTGHTDEAGYCLVASGQKDSMRLISVVMGTPTDEKRSDESARLLNYGFRFFESKQLYTAQKTIAEPRVWMGENKKVAVGLNQDLFVTIPRNQAKNVKAEVVLSDLIKAPVKRGQVLGKLIVKADGKAIAEAPVIALQHDPEGGLWTRITDGISLKLHNWFAG